MDRYPDPKVAHSQHLKYLAKYYFDLWNKLRDDFVNKYEKNLIKYFKKYQDLGCIEITTSGATHGFSPLLATDSNLNAQFKVGQDTTKRLFGKKAMEHGFLNVLTVKVMNMSAKMAKSIGGQPLKLLFRTMTFTISLQNLM